MGWVYCCNIRGQPAPLDAASTKTPQIAHSQRPARTSTGDGTRCGDGHGRFIDDYSKLQPALANNSLDNSSWISAVRSTLGMAVDT